MGSDSCFDYVFENWSDSSTAYRTFSNHDKFVREHFGYNNVISVDDEDYFNYQWLIYLFGLERVGRNRHGYEYRYLKSPGAQSQISYTGSVDGDKIYITKHEYGGRSPEIGSNKIIVGSCYYYLITESDKDRRAKIKGFLEEYGHLCSTKKNLLEDKKKINQDKYEPEEYEKIPIKKFPLISTLIVGGLFALPIAILISLIKDNMTRILFFPIIMMIVLFVIECLIIGFYFKNKMENTIKNKQNEEKAMKNKAENDIKRRTNERKLKEIDRRVKEHNEKVINYATKLKDFTNNDIAYNKPKEILLIGQTNR